MIEETKAPTVPVATVKERRPAAELNPDQQRVIDELIALQALSRNRHGQPQSDGDFARRLGISSSQWCLIRNGEYWKNIKNVAAKLVEMRAHLNRLRSENILAKRFEGKSFITSDAFDAMFSAIEECRQKGLSDTTRVCVFLSPTGGGKSFLGHEVVQRFDGVYVEARQAWAQRSFHALKDICTAYNLDTTKVTAPAKLENMLLEKLSISENPVLYIDEGEYFGKGILDSLKMLVNKTTIVPVIAAIPEYYAKWNTYWPTESAQIRRRTHIVVPNNHIDPSHVERFLTALPLEGDALKEAAVLLATTAQTFGAFDLVSKTVNRLSKETKITPSVFKHAINAELKSMGVDVVSKGGK